MAILLSRRFFLFAPAVVAAANLMPVRTLARLNPLDPLVNGLRYQSWLPTDPQPTYYYSGSRTIITGGVKPLSEFVKDMQEEYGSMVVWWEPIVHATEAGDT
jgi:hypothetical protein